MKYVVSAQSYLEEAIREIDSAKKSILVQTMNFEAGEMICKLESHLEKASRRGVEVRINYDWVAYKFVHSDLQILPAFKKSTRRYIANQLTKNKEMYDRLSTSGVILTTTNKATLASHILPFLGRSHIKMLVVDEEKAWIGGVNLFDKAFGNFDIMVKTEKKNLIKAISEQFYKVNDNKHPNDYEVVIDGNESLYIDVGKRRKSIIYDQAKLRVKEAKKNIIYMSAFVPDSKLLKEIVKASKRGLEVVILTSHEDSSEFNNYPEKLSYIYFKNAIKNQKNIKFIHLKKTVHAKLIIVDGEVALYGSHNYTYSGVMFGTAEIMIETREKEIVRELESFIDECRNI